MSQKAIINFVLFQLGWFACVLGAAKNTPWLGVIVVLAIVAWHLWQAKAAKPEIILLLITLLIGGVFDQLMLSSHLITYQAHGWSNALLPAWILALWAVFITTFNVSLRWMRNRWLIAVLFGAIGGPLAYFAAENLGAVTLNMSLAYVALGLGWAILTPLLLKISTKFDGYR
jgi:FtsH-binding integral membrane protein